MAHDTLQARLQDIANEFAQAVLQAIRSASLDELVGAPAKPNGRAHLNGHANGAAKTASGRLPRRSLDQIKEIVEKIVTLVRKNKDGLRAEQIKEALNLQARELPRVFKEALASKKLRTKGQKRATTYFAV